MVKGLRILLGLSAKRFQYKVQVLKSLDDGKTRDCPCCGFEGPFQAYGLPPRLDTQCPHCLSLERHRLLALADRQMSLFRERDRVLHFAPEDTVRRWIRSKVGGYLSADLCDSGADIHTNIEAMAFADGSFDVVVCSHVLEHVDDSAALAEIKRVLKPSGRLIAMVPIVEGWAHTYENPNVRTPRERAMHFGQSDHVRYYGRDFRDRLRGAEFAVDEFTGSPEQCASHALIRGERVFVCRRK